MKLLAILFYLLAFASCGSYIEKMHNEFDRSDGRVRATSPNYDQFDLYRRPDLARPKRGYKSPVSTTSHRTFSPATKRKYIPESAAKRRHTADDLNDNAKSQSLWHGDGKDSFLFTSDLKKKLGDIIIINVLGKLKDEITAELKRSFPDPAPLNKKPPEEAQNKKTAQKKKPANEEEKDQSSNPSQVYDKISSVIVEEISDDHILLSGRKFLLFKNQKHLIEVQALINRKSLTLDDSIASSEILESNIAVLK